MRTRRILSIVLVLVLLASAVPMAVTHAAADMHYEIPGDTDENDELTKDELVNAILPYMLDEGDFTLDDVGDAAWVYAYWNGEPKTVMEVKLNRVLTFYRPIERVVSTFRIHVRASVALGCCDKLVGVLTPSLIEEKHACGGKLLELPGVNRNNPELTASLRPDIVIGAIPGNPETYQEKVHTPCVWEGQSGFMSMEIGRERTCVCFNFFGELLDKQEEAEELISFINEKYDMVTDITSQIPDSEKPKACVVKGKGAVSAGHGSLGSGSGCIPYDDAGAISLRKDLGVTTDISVEQLVTWNPDVIFISKSRAGTPSLTIEQVLLDPRLQMVNAVKTGSVYYITGCYCWEPIQRMITNAMYMAKIFYPDEFKDLDVEKEGNEVFERFYGVDGLWTEMADGPAFSYYREFIDNPPEEGKWQNVPE